MRANVLTARPDLRKSSRRRTATRSRRPRLNATSPTAARRPQPREAQKILGDCRDLAIRRLRLRFRTFWRKVADVLMDRAGRTDVREEQQMLLDARGVLQSAARAAARRVREAAARRVDDAFAGRDEAKAEFSTRLDDAGQLTLVETSTMDESVIRGNLKRVVENICYDELQQLNRGVGFLLGAPGPRDRRAIRSRRGRSSTRSPTR